MSKWYQLYLTEKSEVARVLNTNVFSGKLTIPNIVRVISRTLIIRQLPAVSGGSNGEDDDDEDQHPDDDGSQEPH